MLTRRIPLCSISVPDPEVSDLGSRTVLKYMFLTNLQTRFNKSFLGKQGQSRFFGQNQMFHTQKIIIYYGWDLAEWLERLTANAVHIVATVLGSIPTSSDTVESGGRRMKQCWIPYKKSLTNIRCTGRLIYKSGQWAWRTDFLQSKLWENRKDGGTRVPYCSGIPRNLLPS